MSEQICSKCVLPLSFPGIRFDSDGGCNYCRESEENPGAAVSAAFKDEGELLACLNKRVDLNRKYDVLVPLSGGVDSCNVLITIVEKTNLRPLVYHNDHGYEDDTATQNVKKICRTLGVDLVITQQEYDFMKKLWKYIGEGDIKGVNTCYVCGNIIYINALEVANNYGIPLVINGYSKGQASQVADKDKGIDILEQLVEVITQTGDKVFLRAFMKKYEILEKRVQYDSADSLKKPVEPDKILFVPFYVFNFYKIDKEVLKEKIRKRFDWQQMKTAYPARTTNCEMIWLNTYMDLKKMGYSNYHIEYAEMIRKGEFTRDQALKDLEFNPPSGLVERLASETNVDLTRFDKKKPAPEEEEQTNPVTQDLKGFEF